MSCTHNQIDCLCTKECHDTGYVAPVWRITELKANVAGLPAWDRVAEVSR